MQTEYQEFPAWASRDDETRLVMSESEFAALGEGWALPTRVEMPDAHEMPGFEEYPKWIDGVIAYSAKEEDAIRGENTQDDREAMIQIAAEKGVKVDKRWSDARLRSVLEVAE